MHAAEQGMELRRTNVGSKTLETVGCGRSVGIQVFIYLLQSNTQCVLKGKLDERSATRFQ